MIKKPIPVALAMVVNSFRSGFVQRFTKCIESLKNCLSGSIATSWNPSFSIVLSKFVSLQGTKKWWHKKGTRNVSIINSWDTISTITRREAIRLASAAFLDGHCSMPMHWATRVIQNAFATLCHCTPWDTNAFPHHVAWFSVYRSVPTTTHIHQDVAPWPAIHLPVLSLMTAVSLQTLQRSVLRTKERRCTLVYDELRNVCMHFSVCLSLCIFHK